MQKCAIIGYRKELTITEYSLTTMCENLQNLQGIHIQVKSEYVGTLTTSEVMTRMQSDKHNNMFNVAANLKHVETHENIN